MSDLKSLEARLDAALERISAATPAGGESADAAKLAAENQALADKLDALNAQRNQDLAQLDELLGQLRPLIEEAV